MKERVLPNLKELVWIALGSGIFALGFDLFLAPHEFGAGGVSGLAVVVCRFIPWLSVGLFSFLLNIPLFFAGRRMVGRIRTRRCRWY